MNTTKLAETVLLRIECFWFLQEVDYACSTGDVNVAGVLDRIYARRPVSWRALHPLIRINTFLALLMVPIAFVARLSDQELAERGFSIKREHDLKCRERGEAVELSPRDLLAVLRNAIAHLPDYASGDCQELNVAFGEGILRCWTRTGGRELIFCSEQGFVRFSGDLLSLCRKAAGRLVSPH